MAGKPLALLLSPALLLLQLPLGGAQLERPRAYCLDSIKGACIRGGEYEVERIMPARGYSGTAGQLVAVLGQRFPPPDTHPITCQLGSAAPTPARYISETELQCDVPSQGDTSVEQLSLSTWPKRRGTPCQRKSCTSYASIAQHGPPAQGLQDQDF